MDLGPNDFDYVRGFREDWERDGRTRFHWTSPAARVDVPYRLAGEGFWLRARVRRHFLEPAEIKLSAEGRTVHVFSIQADTKIPYRVESVPLPRQRGAAPFQLSIQSSSENPRPLGVAIDWIEIERSGSGTIAPLPAMRWRAALVALAAFALPWLLGSLGAATCHAAALLASLAWGVAAHPVAAERILREGCAAYLAVALASGVVLWLLRNRGRLAAPTAAVLAIVVMVGLAVRLALLLHPQFFYPDVRVHAAFARALARQGFAAFMGDFTVNQFRYSLGLQLENGHWYAFPYPPGFYVLAAPLSRWAGFVPEVAVSLTAAAVNSAGALLVFGIARRLGLGAAGSIASAAAVPLLPLFTTRLSLAYFPAMAGQFLDAAVVLYVLARRRDLARPRVAAGLGVLVAVGLLTYTQSLVNLGLLLPGFLALQAAFDRASWRRHLGLAVGAAFGALLALGLFYGRYVPIFIDMRRGVPMAGEPIVLERIAQQERARIAAEEPAETGVDDPYVGPDVDLTRGLRKAAARLWIFYGVFSLAVASGFLLLIKRSEAELARFLIAWGAVYVLLNVGSAGLPGPNLLRYNKDLEIVAPLFCVSLGAVAAWLFDRARPLGTAYGLGYVAWGTWRALEAFTARTYMER
ncbi:MAG TPA: hypothetical protein VFM88_22715 [Vicinamibacteria bacterium]|nr:hypothetical protein [Vicinamibacteria bacterium]